MGVLSYRRRVKKAADFKIDLIASEGDSAPEWVIPVRTGSALEIKGLARCPNLERLNLELVSTATRKQQQGPGGSVRRPNEVDERADLTQDQNVTVS